MTNTSISYSLSNIDEAVAAFWEIAKNYSVVTFSGDMGAGKTTFISHLCSYLQVPDAVSSPTFALVNEYRFVDDGNEQTIYHTDWYRLRSTEEAINAGMEECIDQTKNGHTYCWVEWPEKAPELVPAHHLAVTINTISKTERTMTLYSTE
jgi:tRNA threonylcarbamoyladenosine biosynthesis protein TsaE